MCWLELSFGTAVTRTWEKELLKCVGEKVRKADKRRLELMIIDHHRRSLTSLVELAVSGERRQKIGR